jgi:Met-zincin/Domain of unknown function (DUF5117)/Domain of unknown function (DUF5118)
MRRSNTFLAWGLTLASATAFVVGASVTTTAQDPPPQQQQEPPAGEPGRGGRGIQPPAPRPYGQVITSAAKTDDGIFKVHRVGDALYFEIPKGELDKDFVWNVAIKKTTIGAGFGGQNVNSHVVRWVKRGDRILLQSMDYSITSSADDVVAQAVANANYPAIIRALPVAAYAPNGDAVVDVTALVMEQGGGAGGAGGGGGGGGGVPEFSVASTVGGRGTDATRSFLERAVSFPENINIEATLTFTSGAGAAGAGGGGGRAAGGAGMRGPSGTVLVHHSLMKLPQSAMMSRRFDERVGFNTLNVVDFGTEEHRSVRERIINRYRLEKKDPNAAVSEPVKPIVFYVDPGTPSKWVRYVKEGIESWQPAFEAAGFKGAIQAREAPATDPEWSTEDARYSIVHWVPTTNESQAFITDPRSGEILSSAVHVYPSIQSFGPISYFVQAAPLDKRAQQLPLPDEVLGALVRFQVAHQIGHALGLPHNLKASSLYTLAQVRDPKWVKENSFVPSIMDDARFNYVAQPEDGLDPADLIPKLGPYDKFAISWGYKPVAAKTSQAERTTLDQWARQQDATPYLRFSTEGAAASDPGENAEAVGDADAVTATTLGLKNLAKVSDLMFKATSTKVGDPWDDLEAVYNRMVAQWGIEMNHVVKVVGGLESHQIHIGQQGDRFKTVPKAKQVEALQFLVNNAFTVPAFMVRTDVLRRIQPSGAVERVRTAQTAVLTTLLQNQRIDRMTEQLTIDGPTVAYAPLQFLMDVRNGVWSEAAKAGTAVTIYRRNLQRAYLEIMDEKVNGAPAASAEIKMLVKGELNALSRQLQTAAAAPGLDENTRRHFADAREEIATILDPKVPRPEPAAGAGAAVGGRGRGGVR